ncbi:hypothetical protein IWQ62_001062, partial [Dispira parvispora]
MPLGVTPPPTAPFVSGEATSPKSGKRREIEIEIEEEIPVAANPLVPDEVVKKYDEVMDEMKRVRGALGQRARRKRLLRITEDGSGEEEYYYESMTDDGQSICTVDVPFQSNQVEFSPLVTGTALSRMPHSTSAPSVKSPFHSPPPIIAPTAEPDPNFAMVNENQIIGSVSPDHTQAYKPPTLPVLSPDSLPTGSVPQTPGSPTTNQRYPLRSPGLPMLTKPKPIPIPIPKIKDEDRVLHPTSPAVPTRSMSEVSTARQLFPSSTSPAQLDQPPLPTPTPAATSSPSVKSPGFFRQIKSKVSRAPLLRRRTLSRRESKAKRNKAKRSIKNKSKLSESEKGKSHALASRGSQPVKTRSSQRHKPAGVLDIDSPYLTIPLSPTAVPARWFPSQPSTPSAVSGSGGSNKLSVRNFTEGDAVDSITPTDTVPHRSLPVYSPQHPPIINHTRSLQLDRRLSKEPSTPTALPPTKVVSVGSTSSVQSPKSLVVSASSSSVEDSSLNSLPGVPSKLSTGSLETSKQSASVTDHGASSPSLSHSPRHVISEASPIQRGVYSTGEGSLPEKEMPNNYFAPAIEMTHSLPASPSTLADSQRLPISPFLMAQSFVEPTSLPPAETSTPRQRRSLDSISVISVTTDSGSTHPNAVLKHAQLRHQMASSLDPNTCVTTDKCYPSKTVTNGISVNDSMVSDHSFGVGSSFGHISTPQSHSSVPGSALLGELSEVQNEGGPTYPSQRIRQRVSGPPASRAFPTPAIPSSSPYKREGYRSFDGVLNYHGSDPIPRDGVVHPSDPTELVATSKSFDYPEVQLTPSDSQRLWATVTKPPSLSIVTNLPPEVRAKPDALDDSPSPDRRSDPGRLQSATINGQLTTSPSDVSSLVSPSCPEGSGLGLVHAVVYGRAPWGSDTSKPWLKGKKLKSKFSDSKDAGVNPTIASPLPKADSREAFCKDGQGEGNRLQSPPYTLSGAPSPLDRPRKPMVTSNDCEVPNSKRLSSQSSGVLVQETAEADDKHMNGVPVATARVVKEESPSGFHAPVLVNDASRDADLVGYSGTSALQEQNVVKGPIVSSPGTSFEHTHSVRPMSGVTENAPPKPLVLSPTEEKYSQKPAQSLVSSTQDHLVSPVAKDNPPNSDTIQNVLQSLENELDHELTRLKSSEECSPRKDSRKSPLELDSTQQAVVEWIMATPQRTSEDGLGQNSPLYSTRDIRSSWSPKNGPGSPEIGSESVTQKNRESPCPSPTYHDKGDHNLVNVVNRYSSSALTSPKLPTTTSARPVSISTAGDSVFSPVRIELENGNVFQSSPVLDHRWSNSFTGSRSRDLRSPSSELSESNHIPDHFGTTPTGPLESFSPSRSRVSSCASRRTAGQRSRHSILSALSGIMDTLQNDYVEGLLVSPSKRSSSGQRDHDGTDFHSEPMDTSHVVHPVPKVSICSRSSRENTSLLLPVCEPAPKESLDLKLVEKPSVASESPIPVVSPKLDSLEVRQRGLYEPISPTVDSMSHTLSSPEQSLRNFASVEASGKAERSHIPHSSVYAKYESDTLTESVHVPYTGFVTERPLSVQSLSKSVSPCITYQKSPAAVSSAHVVVQSPVVPTMVIPTASLSQITVKDRREEHYARTSQEADNTVHKVSLQDESPRVHTVVSAGGKDNYPIPELASQTDRGSGSLSNSTSAPNTAVVEVKRLSSMGTLPENQPPLSTGQDLPVAMTHDPEPAYLSRGHKTNDGIASPTLENLETQRCGDYSHTIPEVRYTESTRPTHDVSLQYHSSLVTDQDKFNNGSPVSPIQGSPVWSTQEYPLEKESVAGSKVDRLSSSGMTEQYTEVKHQSIHQATGTNGSLLLSPIYEGQAIMHPPRQHSMDADSIVEHRAAHEEAVEYSQWQGRSQVRDSMHSFAPTCSISSLELSPCLSPTRFQSQVPRSLLLNSAIDDLPHYEHAGESKWDPEADGFSLASPVLHADYDDDDVIPAELSSSWSPPVPVFATDENYSPVRNHDHNMRISNDFVEPIATSFPRSELSDYCEEMRSYDHAKHTHHSDTSFDTTVSDDGAMADELAEHFEIVAGSSVRSIASVVTKPVVGHSNDMGIVSLGVSPVVNGTTVVPSRSSSEDSIEQHSGTGESGRQDLVGMASPHARGSLGSHDDMYIPGEMNKRPGPSPFLTVPVALADSSRKLPEANGAALSQTLPLERVDSAQPSPKLEQVSAVQIPDIIDNSLSPSSHATSSDVVSQGATEQHPMVAKYLGQVDQSFHSSPESDHGLSVLNRTKESSNSPLIKGESVTLTDSPSIATVDIISTHSQPLPSDGVISVQSGFSPKPVSSIEAPREICIPISPLPHVAIGKHSPSTNYSQQVVPRIENSLGSQHGLHTSDQTNESPDRSPVKVGSVTSAESHHSFAKDNAAILSRQLPVDNDTSIVSHTSHGRGSSVEISKEISDHALPLSNVAIVGSVEHGLPAAEYSDHDISPIPQAERNHVDLTGVQVQNPAYSPVKMESTAIVDSPRVPPGNTRVTLTQPLPLENVTLVQPAPVSPSSHLLGESRSSESSTRPHLTNAEDVQQDVSKAFCYPDSHRSSPVSYTVSDGNNGTEKIGLVIQVNSLPEFPEENGGAHLQPSTFEDVNSLQLSPVLERVTSPVPRPTYITSEVVTSEDDDEDEDLAVVSTVSHVRNPQNFQQPQVYDTIDRLRLDSNHSARSSLSSLGRRSNEKSPLSLQSKSITGMDQQQTSASSVTPIPVISPKKAPSVVQIPPKPTPPPKPSARLFSSEIESHHPVNRGSLIPQEGLHSEGIHDQTKVTPPLTLGRPNLPTVINEETSHNSSLLPTPRRSRDQDKPPVQEEHPVGSSTVDSTPSLVSPTALTKVSLNDSKCLPPDSTPPTSSINPPSELTASSTTACAPVLMSVSPSTTSSSVSPEKPIESSLSREPSPSPAPLRSPSVQLAKSNSVADVLFPSAPDERDSSVPASPATHSASATTHQPIGTSEEVVLSPQPSTPSPSHKEDPAPQARTMPFRGMVDSPDRRSAILADAWSDMAQEESYAAVLSSQWDKFHPRLSAVVGHSPSAGPSPVLPPSTEVPDDSYSGFESFMTFSFTSEDHGTPGGRNTISPLGQRYPIPLKITQAPQERKTSMHTLLRGVVSENSVLAKLENITNPNLASNTPAGARSSKVLPPVKVGQPGPSPLGTPKTPTPSTWSSLSSWWSKGPTTPKSASFTATNNLPSRPSPLANSASSSTSGRDPTVTSAPRLQRPMGFRPLH